MVRNPEGQAQQADNAARVKQAESFVRIILDHYWSAEQMALGFGFRHEPNGYEHLVPEEERLELRYRYDEEAFDIRFRPDALARIHRRDTAAVVRRGMRDQGVGLARTWCR